jgi:hypothetical protein
MKSFHDIFPVTDPSCDLCTRTAEGSKRGRESAFPDEHTSLCESLSKLYRPELKKLLLAYRDLLFVNNLK